MKNLIIGTAGHVDHGKTTLVKALTNIDCDSHPEEKRRQLTINLGFAYLPLGEDEYLAFVDVPGHRQFIATMISGATTIDFALLIVAADKGIMPQTEEHYQILKLLGIRKGAVVITKIDQVEPDLLEACEEEIQDFIAGTFFESSPILKVSAKTGQGIPELKNFLCALPTKMNRSQAVEPIFRMYFDRVFIAKGHGTVITGAVASGKLNLDDTIYLFPGNGSSKIRQLQRHGGVVNTIQKGDRAAINLAQLGADDLRVGMVISNTVLPRTQIIDVEITCIAPNSKIKNRARLLFLMGTSKLMAQVHLFDRKEIGAGETAVAQLQLTQEAAAFWQERFILRQSAANITLGGGRIIDPIPLHHKKRTPQLLQKLEALAQADLKNYLNIKIHEQIKPVELAPLATILQIDITKAEKVVRQQLKKQVVCYQYSKTLVALPKSKIEAMEGDIARVFESQKDTNLLINEGLSISTIHKELLQKGHGKLTNLQLKMTLDYLTSKNKLLESQGKWQAVATGPTDTNTNSEDVAFINEIAFFFSSKNMNTPVVAEVFQDAAQKGIPKSRVLQALKVLTSQKTLYRIENKYLHADIVNACRDKLLHHLSQAPNVTGITVAEFRDLVQGNRKICLLLLSIFDSERIIERRDDKRYLTAKGKQALTAQ